MVNALFKVLLDRAPKPDELNEHALQLSTGAPIEDVIKSMLTTIEMRGALREFALRNGLIRSDHIMIDYSQFGELQKILKRIVHHALANPMIVEVGAHGRHMSNSYDLMRTFEWKGLLIEANPAQCDGIARDFAGLDFTLVRCAIAHYEPASALPLSHVLKLSSSSADEIANTGAAHGEASIPVRRLADVLAEHDVAPTFEVLSVDIDGIDIAVVNDLIGNSHYRPTWIIVEVQDAWCIENLGKAGFSEAVQRDYEIVARTLPNLILERRAA